MANPGDKITNIRTGQTMLFIQTFSSSKGELLEIECVSPPTGVKEPEHIHPFQENNFKIISGSCVFSVNGNEQVLEAGNSINIPAKTPHFFYNSGDSDCYYIQEFRPALHIEEFFETFFALSKDGKLNKHGIPNLLHGSVIMLKHQNEIRITKPPWFMQIFAYFLFAPFGWLMGYRSVYKSTK
ncbi:MAG: cupin domain-containing protein [Chitinophagales bacterium]|jgi:quercetin dioxygenase-like cupin family protein|nr:cupin domain-containing protein [Chitinophagales bacterium]